MRYLGRTDKGEARPQPRKWGDGSFRAQAGRGKADQVLGGALAVDFLGHRASADRVERKRSHRCSQGKAGHVGGGVQVFRGVRRGLVEIGAGTYMGMAGQYPIPVEKTHPANEYIDSDRRLAALADLPSTAAIFWYGGAGSVGAVFGPGAVTVAQSEVDRYAMTPEERAEVARQAAKTSLQQWESSPQDRNTPRPGGLKYVGEWKAADDAAKAEDKTLEGNPYSGDMIKKARRGSIKEN